MVCWQFHVYTIDVSFHLITGFGKLDEGFSNDMEDIIGQGVLQESSSAASIYILNPDISLAAYQVGGQGSAFYNPITQEVIMDKAVQYMDNASQVLNMLGAVQPDTNHPGSEPDLIKIAAINTQ